MARIKRSDPAHVWTDEEIKRIEKEIAKEYKQAHEEVVRKTEEYFKQFAVKDAKWKEWVKNGEVTEGEYIAWRRGQMLIGKRWEELCETLAEDYYHAAEIAMSICKEHAPEVYAVNHNYSTFDIEKNTGLDTSYTLYSRETVERMYRENPKLYHDYGKAVAKDIREGKQVAWDKRRVKSVLTQAVLQGESIPKITKRLEIVTGGDHKAAIRNARTMMTGVQNAGRIDAMKRANDLGIPTKKQWLATVDNRTRHWHRELDGVIKDIDEPFVNEIGKIMFPADPDADGANVYNCRCTLLSAIKGFELDVTDPSIRPMPKLKDMTYEEWKNEKNGGKKKETLPKGQSLDKSLQNAYESHRVRNNLELVPLEELGDDVSLSIYSNMANLDNDSVKAFTNTFNELIDQYDTPLTRIRTLSKAEAVSGFNTEFAYTVHDYTMDSAEIVINPLKCKSTQTIAKAFNDAEGFFVDVADDMRDKYIATHEFAHTLVDMTAPLNNKRNYAGADYTKLRRIRKEVEGVYDDYLSAIRPLEKKAKSYEFEYLTTFDETKAEKASKYYDEIDKIKISDYSMQDADEFLAEAFTHAKLSKEKNAYVDRIMEIIDREFRK